MPSAASFQDMLPSGQTTTAEPAPAVTIAELSAATPSLVSAAETGEPLPAPGGARRSSLALYFFKSCFQLCEGCYPDCTAIPRYPGDI